MSGYAAEDLQDAIHAALAADAGIIALVGDRIYDSAPEDKTAPYITIGEHRDQEGDSRGKPAKAPGGVASDRRHRRI